MKQNGLLSRILRYFSTDPDLPRIQADDKVIKRMFEWRRLSVFLSITIGYGIYYVGRLNFSVVKPAMLDEKVLSATQMGIVDSALLFAYAVGKFSNGFIADRANVRKFMSFGLLAVAIINLILGSTSMFIMLSLIHISEPTRPY